MERLHISRKVERTLEDLRRSGEQGLALARKAAGIVEDVKSGRIERWVDAVRICTKYGEKRIESCRKYDLGSGYRLIAIRRDAEIFVPFLGPHDECQRWLERRGGLKAMSEGEATVFPIERKNDESANWTRSDAPSPDRGDRDGFLRPLNDVELRSVFSGLVEGPKKEL